MWIADHLRGIDNPRTNLFMHQMAGTRHLLYGLGEGIGMAFRLAGRLVEREPLICGIPHSP